MANVPAPGAPPSRAPASERRLVFLLATVQFVNILDFMMVMPLGPDFATALGIPTSRIGIIGGSYTAAAAVAGIIGARFLDRFDRRRALVVALLGLVLGTLAGAFATSFATLVGARVVAGLFGGPATSIALAILADAVPPERRGRAMGAIGGAFAAASVLGVPAGLELSYRGTWRTPFFAVAGLALIVVGAVLALMAPQRQHLARGPSATPLRPVSEFLADRRVQLAFAGMMIAFFGVFSVIPNLATFFLYNLHYPREHLDTLYMVGGVVSFFAMRATGTIVDRRGPLLPVWLGTLVLVFLFAAGFIPAHTPLPVSVIFVGFMLGNPVRMVAINTLSSKIPAPAERARFMSAQSAVQHIAAALGAGMSSLVLGQRPDHALTGMPTLALVAVGFALALPFVVSAILRALPAPAAGVPAALSSARGEARAPAETHPG